MEQKIIIIPESELNKIFNLMNKRFDEVLTQLEVKDKLNKDEVSYLTRKETALLLQVSLPTLTSYVKQGIIPANRIGSRVRFIKNDVLEAVSKIKMKSL